MSEDNLTLGELKILVELRTTNDLLRELITIFKDLRNVDK